MNYYYHMNVALIVFAGSGVRMKTDTPKQFIKINDQELVLYTIKKFQENPHIDEIVLVTSKQYFQYTESLVDEYDLTKVKNVVVGGETRQASVRLGLLAMEYSDKDNILIHDGDRPLITNSLINQTIELLSEYQATCPVLDQAERYEEVSNSGRTILLNNKNFDVQTPQGFKFGLIKQAHLEAIERAVSDDISLIEKDVEVKYFPGEKENFKVTEKCDLDFLETFLKSE